MSSPLPAESPVPDPGPGPRSTCPSCQRPVASVRSSLCIYCGKPLPQKVRPSVKAEEAAAVAAEFAALAATPTPSSNGGFARWAVILGGVGFSALLVLGLVGSCFRT